VREVVDLLASGIEQQHCGQRHCEPTSLWPAARCQHARRRTCMRNLAASGDCTGRSWPASSSCGSRSYLWGGPRSNFLGIGEESCGGQVGDGSIGPGRCSARPRVRVAWPSWTVHLEFSVPPSRKRLAFSGQAPEKCADISKRIGRRQPCARAPRVLRHRRDVGQRNRGACDPLHCPVPKQSERVAKRPRPYRMPP
jgi:hypothetical protein